MAGLITVEDPADPRLSDYTDLTDVQLRRRREPAEGLFIAEGEKVIRRAVAAGYEMRSMLLSAKWTGVMRDVIEAATAPVYLVSPALAEQVTGYHVHRGALASMCRRPLPATADLLRTTPGADPRNTPSADPGHAPGTDPLHTPGADTASAFSSGTGPRRIAVFEDIVDHANIGAAFRNAAALGIDAVLLTPRCADPLYRRSVKVSMGAVLHVPWTRLESWPAGIDTLHSAGFTVAAFCLSDRAITLDDLAARGHGRLALLFGTEGTGLTPGALAAADVHVRIPMDAGVDSLNVAATSAVVFYTTRPRTA